MNHYFNQIPDAPTDINSTNCIARLIDGLGFRYYWSTTDLTEQDYMFSPGNGSMTIEELNLHIYDLAFITHKTFGLTSDYKKGALTDFESVRQEILALYEATSKHLKTIDDNILNNCSVSPKSIDGDFPFWFVINGHIADCLTHIGQLVSWRRISGNPQPKVNVFLGR